MGIAGHRDGFFRAVKDVALGDALELESRRGIERFLIDRIPFYFIGSAPQRYIVRAVRTPPSR